MSYFSGILRGEVLRRILAVGQIHVPQNVFRLPRLNAVWASACGTYGIVSDTLVINVITSAWQSIVFGCMCL